MRRLFLALLILLLPTFALAEFVDVVIKTKNMKTVNARLKQIGMVVHAIEEDGTPKPWRDEERYEQCSTPTLTDAQGNIYFTVRLSPEQAAKLPKNDTPTFATIWDSRELDAEGNFLPWPTAAVTAYDLNGSPVGTQITGVPMIGR